MTPASDPACRIRPYDVIEDEDPPMLDFYWSLTLENLHVARRRSYLRTPWSTGFSPWSCRLRLASCLLQGQQH